MPAPTRTDLRDYGIDTRAIVSAPVACIVDPTTSRLYAEGHGLETCDAFRFALTGASPQTFPTTSPALVTGAAYYAIRSNAALFFAATTLANAQNNVAITFSDAGKGVIIIRDLDATIDRMLAADFADVLQRARSVADGDPLATPEDIKAISCRRTAWLLCGHRWAGVVMSKERLAALEKDVDRDNLFLDKLWDGAQVKGLVGATSAQPSAMQAVPNRDSRGLQMRELR